MKFTTTSYTNPQKSILKFPESGIAVPVTMDDYGLSADSEGKKIVPAGTIVGGGTLTNASTKVKTHAPATLTTALAGENNDMVFTAKENRTIKVAYINPLGNNQALSVSVTVDTINVSLKTGSGGAIESTAAEIKAAIEAHYQANELVSVAHATGNSGAGVVIALTATELANGVSAEGVLLNDVDCTYGDAAGAMLIRGEVDTAKLPTSPSTQAQRSLAGRILFMV